MKKIITLILLFVLLYKIDAQTIVKGPYLQIGTSSSMIVRWETNVATDTKVAYGTSSVALTSTVGNATSVTSHSVLITGLTPYTKYYYSIGTIAGPPLQSGASNFFVTSPVSGTPGKYRFWVTGDCGNNSTNQINCKNQYVAYTGTTVTNGWLLLGDDAYNGGLNNEYNTNFFNIYQADIMKNAVLWPAPGNHDYNNTSPGSTTIPYLSIFSTPTAAQAGGVASGNGAYYSYDYGNIHFISLDSYGTIGSLKLYDTTGTQAVWLKNDLAANNKRWTIAYWHHPPYTMGSHNSDLETDLVQVRTDLIRILERYKVDLIMCGHSHDYERSKLVKGHYGMEATFSAATHNLSSSSALYDGSANSCPYRKDSVLNQNGTVYVVSGSAGQLGGSQASFPHAAMYYSNATNGGSMVLDIENNRLDAKWLGADGVIRDKFTIFKDAGKVKSYTVSPSQSATLTASWPNTYLWSNSATTQTIVVTPTSNATYWVRDPNNCVADTFKFFVKPLANFSNGILCANSSISFNDISTNSPISWSWSLTPSSGVTITTPTLQNPTFNFTNPGTYSITLTSSNIYGASAPYTKTVTVNASPTVSVNSGAICAGQSFTIVPGGASTYTVAGGSTVVSPTATTNYNVIGTSSLGCLSTNTAISSVSVNPGASVSVNSATICSGSTATLSASGASTYTWSTGSNASFITISPVTTTTYAVNGTSAAGCLGTNTTATVTVGAAPSVVVNNATVCAGNSATLTASGLTTYTWNTGSNSNNIVVTPIANTTYSVSGNLTGCATGASNTATVTVNALPPLNATTNSSVLCVGQTATLTATGATTYTWNTGSNASVIAVSPSVTTTYTVNGTGSNGCSNVVTIIQQVATCTGLSSINNVSSNVLVYPNPTSGIFNVDITANGKFNIEVYNELNQLVYSGKLNSGNNKIDLKVKNGIYYYTVVDGKNEITKGKILIQ